MLGLVLYVFPMRWHDLFSDTIGHLQHVPVLMVFVQGGRDELTDLAELQPVLEGLGNNANLHVVEGPNHDYGTSGMSDGSEDAEKDTLCEVASVTAAWIRGRLTLADRRSDGAAPPTRLPSM